jgi:hypothetical protein
MCRETKTKSVSFVLHVQQPSTNKRRNEKIQKNAGVKKKKKKRKEKKTHLKEELKKK